MRLEVVRQAAKVDLVGRGKVGGRREVHLLVDGLHVRSRQRDGESPRASLARRVRVRVPVLVLAYHTVWKGGRARHAASRYVLSPLPRPRSASPSELVVHSSVVDALLLHSVGCLVLPLPVYAVPRLEEVCRPFPFRCGVFPFPLDRVVPFRTDGELVLDHVEVRLRSRKAVPSPCATRLRSIPSPQAPVRPLQRGVHVRAVPVRNLSACLCRVECVSVPLVRLSAEEVERGSGVHRFPCVSWSPFSPFLFLFPSFFPSMSERT